METESECIYFRSNKGPDGCLNTKIPYPMPGYTCPIKNEWERKLICRYFTSVGVRNGNIFIDGKIITSRKLEDHEIKLLKRFLEEKV